MLIEPPGPEAFPGYTLFQAQSLFYVVRALCLASAPAGLSARCWQLATWETGGRAAGEQAAVLVTAGGGLGVARRSSGAGAKAGAGARLGCSPPASPCCWARLLVQYDIPCNDSVTPGDCVLMHPLEVRAQCKGKGGLAAWERPHARYALAAWLAGCWLRGTLLQRCAPPNGPSAPTWSLSPLGHSQSCAGCCAMQDVVARCDAWHDCHGIVVGERWGSYNVSYGMLKGSNSSDVLDPQLGNINPATYTLVRCAHALRRPRLSCMRSSWGCRAAAGWDFLWAPQQVWPLQRGGHRMSTE